MKLAGALAVLVGVYFATSVLWMVFIGMIHAQWLHAMPTISYHEMLALAWIPNILFSGALAAVRTRGSGRE